MTNKSNKQAVVLADNLYEDLELWVPFLRIREENIPVQIVAAEAEKTYTSKHGYPVKSDAAAEEINPDDIDLLVIPGGYSPDHMRRHHSMVELVRRVHETGGYVAFICHGGWMACSANILKGNQATSFFAIRDDMQNAGAKWVDEEVVNDNRLISSRTPADLPAFCRELIKALQ
ncbi:MAG TPA: type 1 glutamine amidotransferase domain-containing protein [Tichowtungia sp.]|nr:type 1 glutamine amidotransferase domain-containing protein [Tichowtungia sp.]